MEDNFFHDMFEAANFLTKMVCEKCKVTEDLKNLLKDFLIMSWVFEQLKKQKIRGKILLKLEEACIGTACYLWDKIVDEFNEDEHL